MENQASARRRFGSREELAHACRSAEGLGDPGVACVAGGAFPRPALVSGRRRRGGRARRLAGPGGRRRSVGRALSGQAQSGLHARPRRDAGEIQSQLQQFLRVQHQQAHRRERAENPSLDGQARRPGREGADGRHRCADQGDGARGAPLSPPLRRGLVDGDPLDRLPAQEAGRVRQAALLGDLRAVRDLPRQEDGAGPALVHALALCRGPDHGGSDERSRLHRHRRLRQAARQGPGRADPAGDAVEIRLQVDQVDREDFVRRQAAGDVLGVARAGRIRLLGQRQSGGAASPLEPGHGKLPQRRTAASDADLQRLRREVASLYKGLEKEPLFM